MKSPWHSGGYLLLLPLWGCPAWFLVKAIHQHCPSSWLGQTLDPWYLLDLAWLGDYQVPGSGLTRGSNKASCAKLGPMAASVHSLYAGMRTLSLPVSCANPVWWLSPSSCLYSCCKMLLPSNPWTSCPSTVVGAWRVMTTPWFYTNTPPTSTSRSAMPM